VARVTGQTTPAPATLRVTIGLLAGEAVAVAALAGAAGYGALNGAAGYGALNGAAASRSGWGVTAFAAAIAALLGALAWALLRRRGWARGPSVVLELMLLPIGYYMIRAGHPWFGVPVLLIGLVGAGLLVAPTTREALGIH